MVLDKDSFPIVTVIGEPAVVHFPFEQIYDFHKQRNMGQIWMVHSHPAGATFLSREDQTTLRAWQMGLSPTQVRMMVVTPDRGRIYTGVWWYEFETYKQWVDHGKKGARKMELKSHSYRHFYQECPEWMKKLITLSEY